MRHAMLILALAASPAAGAELVLKDAQGDVGAAKPTRDIIELRLSSGDGRLLVEIETAADPVTRQLVSEDPREEWLVVDIGQLVALAIDSDNNPATGESPLQHEHVTGFEWEAMVLVCAGLNEKGTVRQECAPGSSGPDVVGASPRVQLASTNPDVFSTDEYAGGEFQGRTARVEIPYSKMGVSAGQTVRIYAMERGFGAESDKRFEPVALKLN